MRPASKLQMGLLLFNAVSSIGGGIALMTDLIPEQVEWVEHTDFPSLFFAGVILMAIVGGSAALAAVAMVKRITGWELVNLTPGMIMLVWILGEVASIAAQILRTERQRARLDTIADKSVGIPDQFDRANRHIPVHCGDGGASGRDHLLFVLGLRIQRRLPADGGTAQTLVDTTLARIPNSAGGFLLQKSFPGTAQCQPARVPRRNRASTIWSRRCCHFLTAIPVIIDCSRSDTVTSHTPALEVKR